MFTRKKKRNEEPDEKLQAAESENEMTLAEESSEESLEESSEESSGETPEESTESAKSDEIAEADEIDGEELLKALEEMAPESFADGEKEAVASLALRILEEGKEGALGKETIEMLHGAVALERMVAEADKEGEIRGRNAQIEEQMEIESSGDGLPHLSSISGASPRRVASIFDLAREA